MAGLLDSEGRETCLLTVFSLAGLGRLFFSGGMRSVVGSVRGFFFDVRIDIEVEQHTVTTRKLGNL